MINKLEKYYEDGLLYKQTHPTLDLTIWNYTPLVQYGRLWDEITIQCRGLVTNSKGEIIARPFSKFYNFEELSVEEIPNETFEVFEKMDGSLIIGFYYNDEFILASRGSFNSDYSNWAYEFMELNYRGTLLTDKDVYEAAGYIGINNLTFLFEIIKKENRIVVDYKDFEGLVLLGITKTDSGKELSYDKVLKIGEILGMFVVAKYDGITDYNELKEIISKDAEGFVVRFESGFRMKIKGEEYFRLHRILTKVSNRKIWQHLKNNEPLDKIIEDVPDEFYDWVKKTKEKLQSQFDAIKFEIEEDYRTLINKKEFVEKVKDNKNKHFLFMRLDTYSKKLDDEIWNSIFPNYQLPFKKERDEK